MADVFEVLLLLALPASGKSEVRKYLEERDPAQFHMGPTVQIDDYPYVHLQIRIDELLVGMGREQVFHHPDSAHEKNGPFIDPHENCALVELLNDDFGEILRGQAERPEHAAKRLFERFDAASERAGARAKLRDLPAAVQTALGDALAPEARALFEQKAAGCPSSLVGKTVVIEFARGGPESAAPPLPPGFGYQASLAHLSPQILRRAAILYIWVEPAESRRKNRERARPDGAGSILFHGVPESVMRGEYGTCDMAYLLETADVPGTVRVERDGQVFHVPTARFDNRHDLTTFLRQDPADWSEEDVHALHAGIKRACDDLWQSYRAR